jgi:hypothetical protein
MIGAVMTLIACGPVGQSADQPVSSLPIACALAAATQFSTTCGLTEVAEASGMTVILHHPDGGFRRLRVMGDAPDVIAEDGAFPAISTTRADGGIEVRIENDRYILPASYKTPRKNRQDP